MCLSQLFELAKSLRLPFPRPKLPNAPGYPIPLVFHWLNKAIWPEHDHRTDVKHSSKPVYGELRPKSHSFDRSTAGGVTKGQDCMLKRHSVPLTQSPYECKSSQPITPQSSRRIVPSVEPSENSNPLGAFGNSDFKRPSFPTALNLSSHDIGHLSWPRSKAEKFIVVSHAVHSEEDSLRRKRLFFFDIKDNEYEYHLYVSRHNIPWETAKRVPGETSTTAFTGIVTWIEPGEKTLLYECNLMTKEVTWNKDSHQHVFNIETGMKFKRRLPS